MKLTINFNLQEFKSKDGAKTPHDVFENIERLADALQVLRQAIGKPVIINSAYRSPAHNKRVGGSERSQHLLGKAADIVVDGVPPVQVAEILEELIAEKAIPEGGIGIYNTFTHYDIRGKKARWDFRK